MVNAELDNHKLIHKVKKKREKTTLNIRKTRIVKMKTKIHEHKGTYRMRAWLIPKGAAADPATPFGGQEAK